jgi:hypothetical protein
LQAFISSLQRMSCKLDAMILKLFLDEYRTVEVLDSLMGCDLGNICAKGYKPVTRLT